MILKKYIATCTDDAVISYYDSGDTPEEALKEFLSSSGDFAEYCEYQGVIKRTLLEVYTYTWVPPEESDYDPDEIEDSWVFVLNELVETHQVEAP